MRKIKVLSNSNLPVKFQVYKTGLAYMALDVYKAPEWLWTVAVIYFVILWTAVFIKSYAQERVDILDNKKETSVVKNVKKSKWQKKIEEIQSKQQNY